MVDGKLQLLSVRETGCVWVFCHLTLFPVNNHLNILLMVLGARIAR